MFARKNDAFLHGIWVNKICYTQIYVKLKVQFPRSTLTSQNVHDCLSKINCTNWTIKLIDYSFVRKNMEKNRIQKSRAKALRK